VLLASAVAAVATAAVAGAPTGTLCGSLGDAIWRRLKVLTLDEEQWRTSTGPGPGLLAATSLNTGDCSEMLYGACSPARLPANLNICLVLYEHAYNVIDKVMCTKPKLSLYYVSLL